MTCGGARLESTTDKSYNQGYEHGKFIGAFYGGLIGFAVGVTAVVLPIVVVNHYYHPNSIIQTATQQHQTQVTKTDLGDQLK